MITFVVLLIVAVLIIWLVVTRDTSNNNSYNGTNTYSSTSTSSRQTNSTSLSRPIISSAPRLLSEEGLSVAEILMLFYADKFHTGKNEFQQFWKYHYGKDAKALLNTLVQNDYITTAPHTVTLTHKTVAELKAILKENNLPLSGRKNELLIRITENISNENLKKYCEQQYYMLTEKGQYIVNKYPNVLYAHRHPELELSDREILKTDENAQDIALQKYQSQFQYYLNRNDWHNVRSASLELSQLYNEQKDYLSALRYAVVMAYLDLSGINDRDLIEHSDIKIGENGVCAVLPYSVTLISKLVDGVGMDADSFEQFVDAIVESMDLPYYYYGKSTTNRKLVDEILEYKGLK